MGIGGAGIHLAQQPGIEDVHGVGQVLGDFLLDGAPFLRPQVLTVENAAHADRLDVQGDIEILLGDGEKILSDRLLGVGVEIAPQVGDQGGKLVRREPRTAAEHHVFLGVGRPRKAFRGLVGAGQIIDFGGDHRRQVVGHDHHPQAVLEGGPQRLCPEARAGEKGKG